MVLNHKRKWRGHWPYEPLASEDAFDPDYMATIPDGPIVPVDDETEGGWRRPDWMARGACVGADASLFFPERRDDSRIERAKAICARCPVLDICLEYAIRHQIDHGVWGGCTGGERRKLERAARAAGEL